jgi:hypothetical protein
MDIVKRIRTNPAVIAYAILYLYFNFRNYSSASKSLQAIIKRSYVSIWEWIQKYSEYADKFKVDRHLIKEIFVDETQR